MVETPLVLPQRHLSNNNRFNEHIIGYHTHGRRAHHDIIAARDMIGTNTFFGGRRWARRGHLTCGYYRTSWHRPWTTAGVPADVLVHKWWNYIRPAGGVWSPRVPAARLPRSQSGSMPRRNARVEMEGGNHQHGNHPPWCWLQQTTGSAGMVCELTGTAAEKRRQDEQSDCVILMHACITCGASDVINVFLE